MIIQSTDSPRAVGVLTGLRQLASVGVGDGEVKAPFSLSISNELLYKFSVWFMCTLPPYVHTHNDHTWQTQSRVYCPLHTMTIPCHSDCPPFKSIPLIVGPLCHLISHRICRCPSNACDYRRLPY